MPSAIPPDPPLAFTARTRATSSSTSARTAAWPPGAPVGRPVDHEAADRCRPTSDGRGERSARRSGKVVSHDHCSSGWTSRSAGATRRAVAGRGRAGRAPLRRNRSTDAAMASGASTHVGVDEDQDRARGVRATGPAARRRAACRASRAGGRRRRPGGPAGRPDAPGGRGRRCRRWTRRPAPRARPGRRSGRARPRRARRAGSSRWASSRTGSSTDTGSASGRWVGRRPAQQAKVHRVCTVSADGQGAAGRGDQPGRAGPPVRRRSGGPSVRSTQQGRGRRTARAPGRPRAPPRAGRRRPRCR